MWQYEINAFIRLIPCSPKIIVMNLVSTTTIPLLQVLHGLDSHDWNLFSVQIRLEILINK